VSHHVIVYLRYRRLTPPAVDKVELISS